MGLRRGLQAVNDKLVLRAIRRNTGPVDDSLAGRISYDAREQPPGILVTGGGLPPVEFDYGPLHAPGHIGPTAVTLDLGGRAIRRRSFTTSATFDGRRYELVPRFWRHAVLRRDGEPLATFRRPRFRDRAVRWTGAASAQEQALGHALAAYGGIGAPGAVLNIVGALA